MSPPSRRARRAGRPAFSSRRSPRAVHRANQPQADAAVDAFVEAFSGSHRFVLDYLVEEVLAKQPEDVRSFLLQTSVLDQMTGALCDALTGRSDGQHMLENLDRANLFVVPLDDERRWFRYHHLFADALRVRLQRGEPGPALPSFIGPPATGTPTGAVLGRHRSTRSAAGSDLERAADLWSSRRPDPPERAANRTDAGLAARFFRTRVIRSRPLLAASPGLDAALRGRPGRGGSVARRR